MGILSKLIRSLNDAVKLTSIVVSHDVKETAAISDWIYVISGGKVLEYGTPEALAVSESPSVRQFMLGLPDGPVSFHYDAPPFMDDLMNTGETG
jgi:phospholipid/cholesterol/gamma-HCH transport system ATP-binding protein